MATPQPPGDPNQQPYSYPPQQPQQPFPNPPQPGMRPAGPSSMNFALLTQPQQRGFFIAGIAAAVVVLGFFILPFAGALGYNPPASAYASLEGWLWLVPLCALAAGGLAVWQAVSIRLDPPTGLNRANSIMATIVLGGVATLILIIAFFVAQSLSRQTAGLAGLSWGYWILLLAAIGIAVGGVMQRNMKS
ncbi:MAG TPA: hypothetical protein VIG30_07785 [Ktedonobacterales bacterium]